MAGISREERERRRLAAAATASDDLAQPTTEESSDVQPFEKPAKTGKAESRHWPGFFYDASDPEPEQSNMLGTKDPVWRAWFERNGGKLK